MQVKTIAITIEEDDDDNQVLKHPNETPTKQHKTHSS